MILSPSTLNWSYERPTFEEVEGKILFVKKKYVDSFPLSWKIEDGQDFYRAFDNFLCFAIIADPPEPEIELMELWGVKPRIVTSVLQGIYYVHYGVDNDDCWNICTPEYPTRLEAITAWNRIAAALSQVKE